MSTFNGSVPNPYWFDPLGLMKSVVGETDPAYIWWANAIRGSLGQSLIDMNNFCSQPAPVYVALTLENIQAIGLKTMFLQWMLEYLYSITTSP